jgi:type I restriction enzyme S subunit
MTCLGEVASLERKSLLPEEIETGTSYLGLEHIESGGRILGYQRVGAGELQSNKFMFDPGTLLYGKLRPYLAKICIPDREGCCSTDILPIRPSQELDISYLKHVLLWKPYVDKANSLCSGANLPRISPSSLLGIEIPLPPLEEQRRIAAILDKANELNRLRKRQQSLCRDVELSIYYKEFGSPATNPFNWPTASLAEMAEIFSDGPFGSNLKSSHYVESGIRVVRLQNIGIGNFLDNDKAFVAPSHYETIKKHSCLPGDVLIGTLGEPNLRACMLPDGIPVAINKADCIQMRCDISLTTPLYITHLLNLPETNQMASSLILGQTRGRISMGRLKVFEVPMPPLEKQIQFARKIGALNSLRRRSASSASSIRNLVQSYSSWSLAPKDCQ